MVNLSKQQIQVIPHSSVLVAHQSVPITYIDTHFITTLVNRRLAGTKLLSLLAVQKLCLSRYSICRFVNEAE